VVFAGLTRQRFELPECSRNTAAFISAPSCLSIHPPYLTISATHRPTHHLVLPFLSPPNLHLSPAALSLDKSPSLVLCTLRSNTSIGIWTFSVTTSTLLAAAFLVSPPSLPRSLARSSLTSSTHPEHKHLQPDPIQHHHSTRPNHYTCTFSFENPQRCR
jgi:hypothetical protein